MPSVQVEGSAVGLMSVTTLIDVELLNAAYQLDAYHGLRHPGEDDELVSTGRGWSNGYSSAYNVSFINDCTSCS